MPYIHLSRILKPTGFLLLWIPCLWGLSLQNIDRGDFFYQAAIFLLGAISLRTFGCVINDILDRHLDAKVDRTKNRPLAAGHITLMQALCFSVFVLLPGFSVFLWLTQTQKIIALISFIISLIYPLFKRFTHFPQAVLGLAFSSGVAICGYEHVSFSTILSLYLCGIFWTLSYDTIYAFQDEKDDSIVGIKSTAVYFKKHPKAIITLFYSLCITFLLIGIKYKDSLAQLLIALFLYFYIVYNTLQWKPESMESCHQFFKRNVFIGFLIALYIFYGQ